MPHRLPQNSFEEYILSLGVKVCAVDRSGEDSSRYMAQIKSAIIGYQLGRRELSKNYSRELLQDALDYGRWMMASGLDWRRQLDLLESYQSVFDAI